MSLGEKIKSARINAHITQSQLAEGKITRNMLSQIENGKATPSLATISHISQRLSLPLSYFLENESVLEARKSNIFPKLKELFRQRKYKEIVTAFEAEAEFADDEVSLMMAHTYLSLAEILLSDGYPIKALAHLNKSLEMCRKTLYPTNEIETKCTLYSAVAKNIQSPRLELDTEEYKRLAKRATDEEFFRFISEDLKYDYTTPILAKINETRRLIDDKRYEEALPLLLELEEKKSEYKPSSYLLFRMYSQLEICSRELKNFELAYKYSSKRISLVSAFQM